MVKLSSSGVLPLLWRIIHFWLVIVSDSAALRQNLPLRYRKRMPLLTSLLKRRPPQVTLGHVVTSKISDNRAGCRGGGGGEEPPN